MALGFRVECCAHGFLKSFVAGTCRETVIMTTTLPLQVLSNISKRMADMHDAGFVHRDLKPANVMWLPRENRWTVIDFGCVARINAMAPLSFTLAYAAPEAVHAYEARLNTVHAAPALDSWSLGVMAFELLTGLPAFRMLTDGRSKVRAVHDARAVRGVHVIPAANAVYAHATHGLLSRMRSESTRGERLK